jgi:hypothetical protein
MLTNLLDSYNIYRQGLYSVSTRNTSCPPPPPNLDYCYRTVDEGFYRTIEEGYYRLIGAE